MDVKQERMGTADLVVYGLAWEMSKCELEEFFSSFGEVLRVQVRTDCRSGQPKRIGRVRFADYETQMKVMVERLGGPHLILEPEVPHF